MKTRNTFLTALLLGFTVLMNSCGDSGSNIEPPSVDEAGTPPSISSNNQEKTLVELSEKEAKELNIQTVKVGSGTFQFSFAAPGQVQPAPGYRASVSAPVNGRVAKVYANEGDAVKKGDLLLELESLDFANMLASYMEAQSEEKYQEQQLERVSKLVEQNISPQRELEKTEADLARARVRTRASFSRLQALGLNRSYLQQLEVSQEDQPLLKVTAPISGRINRHMISLGQSVNAYEEMLDIIDNSTVLIKGYLSPEDAYLVSEGDEVLIASRKNESRRIRGKINSINPALDRENRSIGVNIILKTENSWPVIGQTVRVHFEGQTPEDVLSIPLRAIQYEGKQPTVFVKVGDRTYEKRIVELRQITPDAAIVSTGLQGDEEVAVTQVFSLKAKEKFEEFAD